MKILPTLFLAILYKVIAHLIENFLQFVYSSENLYPYIQANNYEATSIYIEKYLPIYQRRLRNSNLMNVMNGGFNP